MALGLIYNKWWFDYTFSSSAGSPQVEVTIPQTPKIITDPEGPLGINLGPPPQFTDKDLGPGANSRAVTQPGWRVLWCKSTSSPCRSYPRILRRKQLSHSQGSALVSGTLRLSSNSCSYDLTPPGASQGLDSVDLVMRLVPRENRNVWRQLRGAQCLVDH